MMRLAWRRLMRRKLVSISIIIAFIGTFVLIPLGYQNTKDTTLSVGHTITEYGRGTYDILVRPESSRTEVEKKLGIVEENYIGDSVGGISIEEWEKLKQHADIEVAAPVASIGYFSGKKLSVELPQLEESTRFTWEFTTTDGNSDYSLGEPRSLVYFKESVPGKVQYLKDLYNESASGATMEVMLPTSYHLLVAIDMESEQKLTNIDLSALDEDLDPEELAYLHSVFGEIPIAKVIQREDIRIPLTLKLKTESLKVDISEYQKKLEISEQDWMMAAEEEKRSRVLKMLMEEVPVNVMQYDIDLSSFQKPFDGTPVLINNQFEVENSVDFVSTRAETPIFYTADKLEYTIENDDIKVNIVEHGNPPSYKKLNKKGISLYESKDVPYLLEQVGTFSPSTVEQNSLSSSPLGIYSTVDMKTKSGQLLKPTTIPGSFIAQPAGALTTLDMAELIKGPKPIDAIRVRVAGIEKYDQAAEEKIKEVAIYLLQAGYEVDIVAGSSLKQVALDIEGIGEVLASWTTLGVAQELAEEWNALTVVTTLLLVAYALMWLIARLLFEKNSIEQENELLTTLGWQKGRIVQRNCLEQYALVCIGYVISLPIMMLLQMERASYVIASTFLLIALLVITIVFSLHKKQALQLKASRGFQSIYYYRHIIWPSTVVLFVSAIVITLQVASLGSGIQQAQVSVMGQFVLDKIYWFQISTLIFIVGLSVIGIAECLHALLYVRKNELAMYHIVGWPTKRIRIHLSKEMAVWTGCSILCGILVSGIVLWSMGISATWIARAAACTIVILALVISTITWTKKLEKGSDRKKDLQINGKTGWVITLLIVGSILVYTTFPSTKNENHVVEDVVNPYTATIKEEEPLTPVYQEGPLHAGASGEYFLDVKLDNEETFQINAEIEVQNESEDIWKDIGFYFIPNIF